MSIRNVILIAAALLITVVTVFVARSWLDSQRAQPQVITQVAPEPKGVKVLVAKVAMPMTSMSDERSAVADDRSTSPGMKPAADVQDALVPRGEIVDILRAVAPFLWGLDDCARFLDDLSAHHVQGADVHARTVRLVARLLAQLHARVDELDPRAPR